MGDIKRLRKKYASPRHPWEKDRIEDEKKLLLEYGLKNKTEIWRMNSMLKRFTDQAKKLIALKTEQSEKEKKQLITKLQRLGLISSDSELDAVLSLTVKDVLERRLQTLVLKKNLAKSARQARQFIVHEHVSVGDVLITSPAYLTTIDEESKISFVPNSSLVNPDHPERIEKQPSKEKIETPKKEVKSKDSKKEVVKETPEEAPKNETSKTEVEEKVEEKKE